MGGKRFFFIKWKDFTTSENTWEPEENLDKCSPLIRDYFSGKGLRNSKSHTLSTALLRSLRVSKQRRSSISSLLSISSPKSSRKFIVSIKPVDVHVPKKQDNLNANRQPGKSLASSVLDIDSPRVHLVRIDLPETLPKVPLEPSVDLEKTEFNLKEKSTEHINESSVNEHSPGSTQLSDSSSVSLSIHLSDESVNDLLPEHFEINNVSPKYSALTVKLPRVSSWASTNSKPAEVLHSSDTVSSLPDMDESNSWENNELQAGSSDPDRTEQNSVPTNSNMDPTGRRSISLELEPNSKITVRLFDQTPRPEVLSAPPVLDEDLDEIEDSDEELLTMRVFEEVSDKENPIKRGSTKKRKRRRY